MEHKNDVQNEKVFDVRTCQLYSFTHTTPLYIFYTVSYTVCNFLAVGSHEQTTACHGSTNTDDKFMIVRGWLTFPPQCLCAFIFISTTLWNSAAIIFHPSNIVLKALLVS